MGFNRKAARWAGCVAGVTAAGLLTAAAPASAVAGGAPVTGAAASALVRLAVGGDAASGGHACTGTLVSSQWILTTASCLTGKSGAHAADGLVDGAPPAVSVAASVTETGKPARQIAVDRVATRTDRDVVLLRLVAPVLGASVGTLAATPPPSSGQVTVAGFGRTATEWIPDAPQSAPLTIAAGAPEHGLALEATGTSGVCRGDAGAPVFTADGRIAGVVTGSYQHNCLGETSANPAVSAARVDDLGDWTAAHTVAGHHGLYRVDANGAVSAYSGTGSTWTTLGTGFDRIYAGESALVATRADTHDVYRYTGTPGQWAKIGGPGDGFVVNADGVYGYNGGGVLRWTGTGAGWETVGPAGTAFYAAGHLLARTVPGSGDLYLMTAPGTWAKIGTAGTGFAINDDGIYGANGGGVYHWTGTGSTWSSAGKAQSALYAGAHTLLGIEPATKDVNLLTSSGWTRIGGSGDSFAANADAVYGVNGGGIYRWTAQSGWAGIGPATRALATD
ncbi:S1 family peptidase [Amycolatopsis sp. NPDC054798]